jgi:hypothetical protein
MINGDARAERQVIDINIACADGGVGGGVAAAGKTLFEQGAASHEQGAASHGFVSLYAQW